MVILYPSYELGPEHTGHFVQPHVAAHCGGDIYSRRKPLFSSFGEHTAVCGSSVQQAVARPRHRQSVCIHNIHVAATCRPSVLGSATMRGHMWLNKVASVLGPLPSPKCANSFKLNNYSPSTIIIQNYVASFMSTSLSYFNYQPFRPIFFLSIIPNNLLCPPPPIHMPKPHQCLTK